MEPLAHPSNTIVTGDRNPVLAALGCGAGDRVAIVHADDVGLCEATLSAFLELAVEHGTVSSGSVMTPSPWCPGVAARCRAHPAIDLGVHLTLTSEWAGYRWRPLSPSVPGDGLVDEDGYFHRRVADLQARAAPAAVRREIAAQIAHARRCGLAVTHVDSHMFALAYPAFVHGYVQAALAQGLAPLVPREASASFGASAALAADLARRLERSGVPLVDRVVGLPLDQPDDRLARTCALLRDLPAGISQIIVHPATDTPELRAIAEDWPARVADYQALRDPRVSRSLSDGGIRLISVGAMVRALRDARHGGLASA